MHYVNVFGVSSNKKNTIELRAMRILLRNGSIIEVGTEHMKKDGSLKKKAVAWLRGLQAELA